MQTEQIRSERGSPVGSRDRFAQQSVPESHQLPSTALAYGNITCQEYLVMINTFYKVACNVRILERAQFGAELGAESNRIVIGERAIWRR